MISWKSVFWNVLSCKILDTPVSLRRLFREEQSGESNKRQTKKDLKMNWTECVGCLTWNVEEVQGCTCSTFNRNTETKLKLLNIRPKCTHFTTEGNTMHNYLHNQTIPIKGNGEYLTSLHVSNSLRRSKISITAGWFNQSCTYCTYWGWWWLKKPAWGLQVKPLEWSWWEAFHSLPAISTAWH